MSDEQDDNWSPYCPECNACGESGCCPPHTCHYFHNYKNDYTELAADWNRLYVENAALKEQLREAVRLLMDADTDIDYLSGRDWMERCAAFTTQNDDIVKEIENG